MISNPAPIPVKFVIALLVANIILGGGFLISMSPIWSYNARSILYSKPNYDPVAIYTPLSQPPFVQTQTAKGCMDLQAICVPDMLDTASSLFSSLSPLFILILIALVLIGIPIAIYHSRRGRI